MDDATTWTILLVAFAVMFVAAIIYGRAGPEELKARQEHWRKVDAEHAAASARHAEAKAAKAAAAAAKREAAAVARQQADDEKLMREHYLRRRAELMAEVEVAEELQRRAAEQNDDDSETPA